MMTHTRTNRRAGIPGVVFWMFLFVAIPFLSAATLPEAVTISSFGYSGYPDVAVLDGGKTILVVWVEGSAVDPVSGGGGYRNIKYKLFKDGQWGPKQSFVATGAMEFPRLAADSQGNIHMTWMDGIGGFRDIAYARFRNGAWDHWENTRNTTYFAEVSPDERSVFASPVVDENDTLHVVFSKHKGWNVSGDAEIFYVRKPLGGSWSAPTRITNENYSRLNYYPDIAARDGKQYIIWEKYTVGIFVTEHSDGGAWSSPVKITGLKWPSIDVDSGGGRHAETGASGYLYQRRLPGSGWINYGKLVTDETYKGRADIEVDAFDNVYAVFMQGPEYILRGGFEYKMGRLNLARLDSRALPPDPPEPETLWKRDGAYAKAPQIVADNNGGLHVVFYDASFEPNQDRWQDWGPIYYIKVEGGAGVQVKVLSPNGGEEWRIGEEQTLTWEATAPAGAPAVEVVQVEYSLDSGATWNMLYDAVPNTGTATGEIPRDIVQPSTHCRFRISDPASGFSDISDADFTLLPPQAESGASFVKNGVWQTATQGLEGFYVGNFVGTDGFDDIMNVTERHQKVFRSDGTQFIKLGSWIEAITGLYGWFPGDFNGDGLTDIMRYREVNRTQVFLSTGTAFVKDFVWAYANPGSEGYTVGDFNGDGIDDMLIFDSANNESMVYLSSGEAFLDPVSWFSGHTGSDGWYTGDFNGDGKTDLARVLDGTGTQVMVSTGTSFFKDGVWTTGLPGSYGWFVGDFNGDGYDDLMRYLPDLSGADVFLSNGEQFNYDGSWTAARLLGADWRVGDFTGDGRDDLLRYIVADQRSQVFVSTAGTAPAATAAMSRPGILDGKDLNAGVDTSRPTLSVESEADLLRPWLTRIRNGEEGNYFFKIKAEYENRLGRKVRDVVIYRMLSRHLSARSR